MPLLPCFLNLRVLGSRPESPLVNWLGNLPRLSGSGLPRHFSRSGFGSNRSSGDGPPTMNMKMTDLALASKCGFLGARGLVDVGAAAASRRISHDRAMPPRPPPARYRKSRRSTAGGRCGVMRIDYAPARPDCKPVI